MKRNIKYIGHAVKWQDRTYGNTYHSVRIIRCRDGKTIACPMQYGYGDQFRQTALEAIAAAKWLPPKYRERCQWGGLNTGSYESDNNYPVYWIVEWGTKAECNTHGLTEG